MRPHRPSWVHSHHDREPDPVFTLADLAYRIDQISAALRLLTSQGAHIMATLADIQAAETAEAVAIDSVLTEIAKLQADLAAAQAGGADPAAMQAIVDQIHANTAKLTASLPPVTPTPTPEPTPAPTTLG